MFRISTLNPNGSSTLIYSGVGNVNVPLTLDAFRIDPSAASTFSHVGHHLIEVIFSASGEMFADIEPDPTGRIVLYGKTEDIELGPEIRARFGVCCRAPKGSEPGSVLPALIKLKFRDRDGKPARDAGGNPIGPFIFNFNIQLTSTPAIFATNAGFDVPEMMCERRRRAVKTFQLTTIIQPNTTLVRYSTSTPSTNPNFTHTMRLGTSGTTSNLFRNPFGPIVDQEFRGVSNSPVDDHFFVTAEDTSSGRTHSIPFISYMSDTPKWGELAITGYEFDPAGPDRGNETITLRNTSSRLLSLNGCFMVDELLGYFGFPRASGGAVRTNLPRRHLAPGATLVVRPDFELNNDYDGFTLHNRFGSLVSLGAYVRRSQGNMPPAPGSPHTVTVTPTLSPKLILDLEDGDEVIIDPNPSDRLWAGVVPDPATGPEGWFDLGQQVANFRNWALPLPAAPVYSLVMTSFNQKKLLIGNRRQRFVVDRKSRNTSGLFSGRNTLQFGRNDDPTDPAITGRLTGHGQFNVTVTVLRH